MEDFRIQNGHTKAEPRDPFLTFSVFCRFQTLFCITGSRRGLGPTVPPALCLSAVSLVSAAPAVLAAPALLVVPSVCAAWFVCCACCLLCLPCSLCLPFLMCLPCLLCLLCLPCTAERYVFQDFVSFVVTCWHSLARRVSQR